MLVPLVLIDYFPIIYDPIITPQIFSPANVVFSGIGVLLLVGIIVDISVLAIMTLDISQTAKDVDSTQDMLVDIFVRIESFFKRLESYTEVRPTAAMTDVIVKILIEILSILGIATKQIKQGRSSESTNIHN